jgi:murein tripeptide amidase MpaA
MTMVLKEFPEVIRQIDVGQTYLDRTIPGYLIGLNFTDEAWEQEALGRPGILINGAHHSRELTSISMNVYTVLRLMFDFVKGDGEAVNLLNDSAIFIIPVINVDGFEAIGKAW